MQWPASYCEHGLPLVHTGYPLPYCLRAHALMEEAIHTAPNLVTQYIYVTWSLFLKSHTIWARTTRQTFTLQHNRLSIYMYLDSHKDTFLVGTLQTVCSEILHKTAERRHFVSHNLQKRRREWREGGREGGREGEQKVEIA